MRSGRMEIATWGDVEQIFTENKNCKHLMFNGLEPNIHPDDMTTILEILND